MKKIKNDLTGQTSKVDGMVTKSDLLKTIVKGTFTTEDAGFTISYLMY
jgi:hypothetical protein